MSGELLPFTTLEISKDGLAHRAIEKLVLQRKDIEAAKSDVFANTNSFVSGALVVLLFTNIQMVENSVDVFSTAMIFLVAIALSTVAAVWLTNHVITTADIIGEMAFELILFNLKLLQGYFFMLFFNLIRGNLLLSVDPYGIIPLVCLANLYFFFSKFLTAVKQTQYSKRKST